MSKGPPDWATAPHDDTEPGVEVRLNGDGTIDEIVTERPVHFHLEQMDDGQYWIGLDWKVGKKSFQQAIWLHRHGKHIGNYVLYTPTLLR